MNKLLKVLLISFLALMVFSHFFIFNFTASEPVGLYMKMHSKPAVGDYAIFSKTAIPLAWQDKMAYPYFLKHVAAQNEQSSYMLGSHPKSFDSRYYGRIDNDELVKVKLIWRFG